VLANITPRFLRFAKADHAGRRFWVGLFFLLMVVLGWSIYSDYGFTRDESINRQRGIVTINYLGKLFNWPDWQNIDPLKQDARNRFEELSPTEAEHGAVFESASAAIEKLWFGNEIATERDVYRLRHLLIYLTFVGGVFALYQIAASRFADWRLGLLAALMLVLSPRIFGNAFFNSMDIVFLASFTLAANASLVFFLKPNWRLAFLGGLWSAIAFDVRNLGILVPALILALIFWQWLIKVVSRENKKDHSQSYLKPLFIYLITFIGVAILFWPWLWESPWERLWQAFVVMAHIPFELEVLYLGNIISSFAVPWHYVPVWIAISSPIIYLPFFVIGLGFTFFTFIKSPFLMGPNRAQLQDLFFTGLFLAPIVAVIVFHSALYDSWRHLFFVYPFFILLTLKGWVWFLGKIDPFIYLYRASVICFSLYLVFLGVWMFKAHPFESMYFNTLAGKDWKSHFDVDYWSLGSQKALEYVVRHDTKPFVKVGSVSQLTDFGGSRLMDSTEHGRLYGVHSPLLADYMIDIFRTNPAPFINSKNTYAPYHDIKIGDETIISIYKNQLNPPVPSVEIGEKIEFNKAAKGTYYLLGIGVASQLDIGWHYPENWGTWAAADKATLLIAKPSKDKPQTLTLEMNALVSPKHPIQRIEIRVGGGPIQNFALSKPAGNMITLDLSQQKRPTNYVEVEIRSLDRIAPKAIGIGQDERLLGFGLVAAYFEK